MGIKKEKKPHKGRTLRKQKDPLVLKKLALALVITVFAALVYMTIAGKTNEAQQRIELQKTYSQLKVLKNHLEATTSSSQETQAQKDAHINELNTKLEEANSALQAKKEANTAYAAAPAQKPSVAKSYSGTKEQWMSAAGIPQSQWGHVDSIVTRESGWNPNAVNPDGGACGLGQQLPCGKWAGAWNDPVAALRAQHQYVNERYGGYAQAVAFWNINHWY